MKTNMTISPCSLFLSYLDFVFPGRPHSSDTDIMESHNQTATCEFQHSDVVLAAGLKRHTDTRT